MDSRVVLACLFLAACGGDDAADSAPQNPPASRNDTEDAGADHADRDAGARPTRPSSAGRSSSARAGSGGATASASGSGGTAAPSTPAAGSGGSSEAGEPGKPGRSDAGSGGRRGRPEAGNGGPRGRPEAGGGGEGGRSRPGRGNDQAGAGSRASSADCPSAAPAEGSACDGLSGLRCNYDEQDCRCRNSEPIWTCEPRNNDRGGNGQGGAGRN